MTILCPLYYPKCKISIIQSHKKLTFSYEICFVLCVKKNVSKYTRKDGFFEKIWRKYKKCQTSEEISYD